MLIIFRKAFQGSIFFAYLMPDKQNMDVSHSQVVMGGNSNSEDRGFESQYCTLGGHFFTSICCKICNVCLKKELAMALLETNYIFGRGGGGLSVSIHALYYSDLSLIPAYWKIFF